MRLVLPARLVDGLLMVKVLEGKTLYRAVREAVDAYLAETRRTW